MKNIPLILLLLFSPSAYSFSAQSHPCDWNIGWECLSWGFKLKGDITSHEAKTIKNGFKLQENEKINMVFRDENKTLIVMTGFYFNDDGTHSTGGHYEINITKNIIKIISAGTVWQ